MLVGAVIFAKPAFSHPRILVEIRLFRSQNMPADGLAGSAPLRDFVPHFEPVQHLCQSHSDGLIRS